MLLNKHCVKRNTHTNFSGNDGGCTQLEQRAIIIPYHRVNFFDVLTSYTSKSVSGSCGLCPATCIQMSHLQSPTKFGPHETLQCWLLISGQYSKNFIIFEGDVQIWEMREKVMMCLKKETWTHSPSKMSKYVF